MIGKQKQPPEVFYGKKVFLKISQNSQGNTCAKVSFSIKLQAKLAGLRPATLLKKRLWRRCFPVNFAKFLRTPFLHNTSQWLLLDKESWKVSFLKGSRKKRICFQSSSKVATSNWPSQKKEGRPIKISERRAEAGVQNYFD